MKYWIIFYVVSGSGHKLMNCYKSKEDFDAELQHITEEVTDILRLSFTVTPMTVEDFLNI